MAYSKKIAWHDSAVSTTDYLPFAPRRGLNLPILMVIGILTAGFFGIRQSFDAVSNANDSAVIPQNTVLERVGLKASNIHVATALSMHPIRLPFEPRVAGFATRTLIAESAQDTSNIDYSGTEWRTVVVKSGDNLSKIWDRIGATRDDLPALLEADPKAHRALVNLTPGQILHFRFSDSGVQELVYEQSSLTSLRCTRDGEQFHPEWLTVKPEIRVATATTEITRSLFVDGQKVGLPDKTILEFINIFGWDVDFLRDLRPGDRFSVVFEEVYKGTQKIGNGRILGAEFFNDGKRLTAVYYKNKQGIEGYFSDAGQAMRKAFLRTPVNFTRISSGFSLARKHPVLNTIRAHKGVDYAAPLGTPVRAVADGNAEYVGWQAGYGNVIVLKHGDTYSTLYGHLSRFAKSLTKGMRVTQGDTIGFVGQTGLATGTHLHYEFRINGAHHDPLAVKLPNSFPIEHRFLADFKRKSAIVVAQLNDLNGRPKDASQQPSMVARAEQPANR
ncbi:MAG: peptidoglycan DD-metalloendopeptidase family protein [Gammaproteobacteria bacterium]|nr:peptidoglycan DD-metalloendopeptidase family protein [Gammaproteobacteria bacterium]